MSIYLDHAATTPLRAEARDAMLPYLGEVFGNPSSPHATGRRARRALDEAREAIATAIGAQPREVVLTSGGTEALNLGLKGAAWAGRARGNRIVVSAVEHHAVGETAAHLERFGFEVTTVDVDRYGRVDPDAIEAVLTDRTIAVAVMLANNEVGTIEPVAEVARRVHERRGCLVLCDAVQAAGWLDIDVDALGVDLLAIGAHKFEGPKGVGALYLRAGTHILAQQHGGSQERHRRAGTEDVAGAVGMATALRLARSERAATNRHVEALRDRLVAGLTAIDGVELTGHPTDRLPNNLSLIVRGAEGEALVNALDLAGIEVSVGSACTTGSPDVSHVLAAMGYPDEEARGAIRMSLGRTTTGPEIDEVLRIAPTMIDAVRAGVQAMAEVAEVPAAR
jgi:cysteine desulfurase